MLGTRREHQEQFRIGSDMKFTAVQQHVTDALARLGSAGLAGNDHIMPCLLQPFLGKGEAGAFAGTFPALQCNK